MGSHIRPAAYLCADRRTICSDSANHHPSRPPAGLAHSTDLRREHDRRPAGPDRLQGAVMVGRHDELLIAIPAHPSRMPLLIACTRAGVGVSFLIQAQSRAPSIWLSNCAGNKPSTSPAPQGVITACDRPRAEVTRSVASSLQSRSARRGGQAAASAGRSAEVRQDR